MKQKIINALLLLITITAFVTFRIGLNAIDNLEEINVHLFIFTEVLLLCIGMVTGMKFVTNILKEVT